MAKLLNGTDTTRKLLHEYRVISCPLFQHRKHTDACTVLRAKGVCRMKCQEYFVFAKTFPESVKTVVDKYRPNIVEHRRRFALPTDIDFVEYAVPAGDNICIHCGKAFVHETRLKSHLHKEHRREELEKKQEIEEIESKKLRQEHDKRCRTQEILLNGKTGRNSGTKRVQPKAVSIKQKQPTTSQQKKSSGKVVQDKSSKSVTAGVLHSSRRQERGAKNIHR